MDLPASPPTIGEVDRIAALEDPVIRNLQITQCYHELSVALARRTASSANWCTFATWASKQAGQTIRKEDMLRALQNLLRGSQAGLEASQDITSSALEMGAEAEPAEIRETVWEILNPAAVFERSSQAVARGNIKVFAEIGKEFARFFDACLADTLPDSGCIEAFCAKLRPGDPPDGQSYLQDAFECYYRAMFESDAKKRAEILFQANLEIGFHEQTRLQPEIREAMDTALPDPEEFTRRLIIAIFPYGGLPALLRWFFLRLLKRRTRLDDAAEIFLAAARLLLRQVITEHLMAITLPPEVRVRLGDDLTASFPASLKEITDLDLSALLERIDPTPNSPSGSGARDWANLPDRLHFICDLFRCYAEAQDLLSPPFTIEQTAELKAGRLPDGRL